MNRCLTPRQQELVDLAGTLAGTFAERAAAHDRDNTFPVANYADLLRQAAQDKLIWASVTSEPGMRNDMTDAKTVATKVDGGFRLTGRRPMPPTPPSPRTAPRPPGTRRPTAGHGCCCAGSR